MGAVIALHRGASSRSVRISRVGNKGDWSPVGLDPLEVPTGVPDLSFASFSPKGQLWVGLRYVDKEQDACAYAAEVYVDDSRVVYHRQRPTGTQPGVSQRCQCPVGCHRDCLEGIDGSMARIGAGAVRLWDNKTVKVFTENDGLESELVHDVIGRTERSNLDRDEPRHRRVGRQPLGFPQRAAVQRQSQRLARDPDGRIWIGTDRGVIEVVAEKRTHQIGTRSGLLDDKILNMGVDVRSRLARSPKRHLGH